MALVSGTFTVAVSDSVQGATGAKTASYTMPTGTDRGLVVIIGIMSKFSTVDTVSSVSYDSVTMEPEFVTVLGDSSRLRLAAYSLIAPSTGANDIGYTLDGVGNIRSHFVVAIPFTGAHQTDMIGVTATEQATSGSTNVTLDITTGDSGSLVVGAIQVFGGDGDPFTPATSVTEKIDGDTASTTSDDCAYFVGEMDAATANTYTFGADANVNDGYSCISFEVLAAAGGVSITASAGAVVVAGGAAATVQPAISAAAVVAGAPGATVQPAAAAAVVVAGAPGATVQPAAADQVVVAGGQAAIGVTVAATAAAVVIAGAPGATVQPAAADQVVVAGGAAVVAAGGVVDLRTGVEFDGTNDWLTVSGLSGAADGRKGTVAFLYKPTTAAGTLEALYGFSVNISRQTTGKLRIRANGTTTADRLDIESTITLDQNRWYSVIASWDLTGGAGDTYLRIDDVDVISVTAAATDEDIDYTRASDIVGASNSGGSSKVAGCLGEFYFSQAATLDLDTESNRRLFFDANGNPADKGADGSTPTSSQPIVYLSGDAAQFEDNFGSGGAFTVNGALVDCPIPVFAGAGQVVVAGGQAGIGVTVAATGAAVVVAGAPGATVQPAAADQVVVAGGAAVVSAAGSITANAGAVTVTGEGAGMGPGAAPGAVVVTDQVAAFVQLAAAGTIVVTGGAAVVATPGELTANAGAVTVTGEGAGTGPGAAPGAVVVTDQVAAFVQLAAAGTVVVTGIRAGVGAQVDAAAGDVDVTGGAGGAVGWELGSVLLTAYQDAAHFLELGDLATADLDHFVDAQMGFGESVTYSATSFDGHFEDYSVDGEPYGGPRVRIQTTHVLNNGMERGDLLTIRGRTFDMRGFQHDGVGFCVIPLREVT